MRIAMWSGPRNLSTAMMYSFAQRSDFAVWDEPFYAAYLTRCGLNHPLRAQSIAAGEVDPEKVIAACLGPVPAQKPHFYQKHMTQHMLPEFGRNWMAEVTNVFLIRHPARVVDSFAAKLENPTLDDIGFRQQAELYDFVAGLGTPPLVIDSDSIRADPAAALGALCDRLGLAFDPAMLTWRAGGIPEDGVWAPHWYGALHRSTGFAGPEAELPVLGGPHDALAQAALPYYTKLAKVCFF